MTATNQDVGVAAPFVQGDSLTLEVPVFAADGTTPEDISGASAIRWEAFRAIGGVPVGAPLVAKALGAGVEVLAALPGEDFPSRFKVSIEPADSEDLYGTYHHEAEITFVTGVRSTVLTGRWVIQQAGVKPAA